MIALYSYDNVPKEFIIFINTRNSNLIAQLVAFKGLFIRPQPFEQRNKKFKSFQCSFGSLLKNERICAKESWISLKKAMEDSSENNSILSI